MPRGIARQAPRVRSGRAGYDARMFVPRACSHSGCGRPALSGAPSCIVHLPGAAAHVATFFGRPGERRPLVDLDLPGIRIEDADLSGAEISGCRLTAGTFVRVSFRGAQIALSFLDRATFEDCDVSGASLVNVVMAGSTMTDCSFADGEIAHVNFLGIHAMRTGFDHSNLYGSRFIGALLEEVSMKDCNCTRAWFDAAHRDAVDFRSSNTNEALFQEPTP